MKIYHAIGISIIAMLAAIAAHAQTATIPPPDYGQQAISQRLTAEINNSLQLQAALLAAQDEVKKLNAEIAALKAPPAEPAK